MEFSDGLLSQEVGVKKLKEKWAAEAAAKAAKAKAAPGSASRPATPSMPSRPDAPAAPPVPPSRPDAAAAPPVPPSRPDAAAAAPTPHPQVEPPQATPTPDPSRFPGSPGLPVTPGAHWRPPANAPARFIVPQQPFAPVFCEYQPIPSTPMPYGPGCPGTPPLSSEVRNESTKSSSATVEALGVLLFDYYYYNIKKGLGFRDV